MYLSVPPRGHKSDAHDQTLYTNQDSLVHTGTFYAVLLHVFPLFLPSLGLSCGMESISHTLSGLYRLRSTE